MEESKPEVEANGTEELTSDYANNTFLQPTVWDLKILFGELTAQGRGIEWHTAITIPWAQAKLFSYYLQLNIESHEMQNGKITIPDALIPPPPPSIPPEHVNDPQHKAFFALVAEARQKFLQSLK